MPSDSVKILIMLGMLILLFLYVLPTVIAFFREHPLWWLIGIINILLGVTVLGWIFCFFWSLSEIKESLGEPDNFNTTSNTSVPLPPDTAKLLKESNPKEYLNIANDLEKLAELKSKEILSPDEFEACKNKLLENFQIKKI